jgi:hypothetical protein
MSLTIVAAGATAVIDLTRRMLVVLDVPVEVCGFHQLLPEASGSAGVTIRSGADRDPDFEVAGVSAAT